MHKPTHLFLPAPTHGPGRILAQILPSLHPLQNVASLAKPRVCTHGDRQKDRSNFCVAPDGLGSLRELRGAALSWLTLSVW